MKIRFTELQVDDGAAGALEFFGARVYDQSAFARELRNTRCNSRHTLFPEGNLITLRRTTASWECPAHAGYALEKVEQAGAHATRCVPAIKDRAAPN
jgi:hypothetical protein